jgi:phosphatidylglycerophosphatase A
MTEIPQPPAPSPQSPAVWLATGLGIGLMVPAIPGSVGAAVFGLPLAWAIGRLPGISWEIVAIIALNLMGIPVATAAGRALGGKKDNQAIVWDEIATMPIVFLLVPFSNWRVALLGLLLHRAIDIAKPPPASQLERLPDGLGVMADDWIAGAYACAVLAGLAWADNAVGWGMLTTSG